MRFSQLNGREQCTNVYQNYCLEISIIFRYLHCTKKKNIFCVSTYVSAYISYRTSSLVQLNLSVAFILV